MTHKIHNIHSIHILHAIHTIPYIPYIPCIPCIPYIPYIHTFLRTYIHARMHIHMYIYIYTYMVNDLKVLVKSFNCEDRSCYAGNLHESFFFCEFTKYFIYSQNFAKVGYYESLYTLNFSLLRATTSCRPGVGQENGTAHSPFPS